MTFSTHFEHHTQTFWYWGISTFTWTHSPADWLLKLNRCWTASASTCHCHWSHPYQGPHTGPGYYRFHPKLRPSHPGHWISDNHAITFRIPSPLTKPQCLISLRNFKNIDSTSLSQHLQLLSPPPNASVTDLMDFYSHNLHSILESHAPLKTRTVTFTRTVH